MSRSSVSSSTPIVWTSRRFSARMDFATIFLIAGILALIYLYFRSKYSYWEKRGIPTAKNLVYGLGHDTKMLLMQENIGLLTTRLYKEHPGVSMVGVYSRLTPALVVRDPELVKQVMITNFSNFHENLMPLNPETDKLLAANPFFNSGDRWKQLRSQLTYAFSSRKLKTLFEAVSHVGQKLNRFLERKIKENANVEFELKDLFSRYTGEVVANAGFGIEGECFSEERNVWSMYEIGKEVFEPKFTTALNMLMVFFLPFLGRILQLSFLPKRVDRYFRKIVHDVLTERREKGFQKQDFFQAMLDLEKERKEKIEEASIAAHATSFFVDGFETSSLTLMFIGYHLAKSPRVQEKLRKEVLEVTPKNGGLTYDSLKDMTYMDQVINEAMRVNSVIGSLGKVCTAKTTLQGSDGLSCTVEPGTIVTIPVVGIQLDGEYYQDPEKFLPERFDDGDKEFRQKGTLLAFGDGPRVCAGMRMALLQMKVALATIVTNYQMELSPKTKEPLKINPTYFLNCPIGGVWVKFRPLHS